MAEDEFTLNDITPELAEITDMYLKRVLINRKKRYYRELASDKGNVQILELEDCENSLAYEEEGFDKTMAAVYTAGNTQIPIGWQELAEAMDTLTEMQLQILLRTEVLGCATKEIAQEYGISQRMVCKHRRAAIEKVKKVMNIRNEK